MAGGRFPWTPLFRLLLGLALMAFLARSIGVRNLQAAVVPARAHPAWIAAALALTFAALFAGAVRWHLILRAMDLPTPFSRTYRGFFIGQFFNAFLFGACGGDLARAVVAAHDHSEKRAEAVASVFLDRAIGLVVTLFCGCAMILPRIRIFAGHEEARLALVLMGIFFLAALAFIALFFARNLFERIPGLWRRGRIGPLLHRAYDALFLFRRNVRHLFWPAILSVANLLLLAAATAALARALDISIAFPHLLAVFPVVTVLAAIPLTPGSLGVREGLYVQLLHPFGIPPGSALMLSLLGYLAASFWSFHGALFFLRRARTVPGRPGNPEPSQP